MPYEFPSLTGPDAVNAVTATLEQMFELIAEHQGELGDLVG